MTYLLQNNLLSNCLIGFVSGRSDQLQILSLLDHWTDTLDSVHTFDVISWISKKRLIQFTTYAFSPNYIPLGYVIRF